MLNKIINLQNFKRSFKYFQNKKPFYHVICDDFFNPNFLEKFYKNFPDFNQKNFWYEYNNALERKKTCNDWNKFDPIFYNLFNILNSNEFTSLISKFSGIKKIYPDPGLNGGGIHIYANKGKLNPHLDYDIHPKLNLKRKLNLIIYLNKNWREENGGLLGLWTHNKSKNICGNLYKEIKPKFNRAILFDVSSNCWHGLSKQFVATKCKHRKSVAVYYLIKSTKKTARGKALFSLNRNQQNDVKLKKLIKLSSKISSAHKVYKQF